MSLILFNTILIFANELCNFKYVGLQKIIFTEGFLCTILLTMRFETVWHTCRVVSYKSDFFIILHISDLTKSQQNYNNTKSCHGLFRVSMTTLYCMSYSTDKAVIDTICLVMLFTSVSLMNKNKIKHFV